MTKEVAKTETTALTMTNEPTISGINFKDIGINFIGLAQPMSVTTTEGKTAVGDIYDATSKTVLAKKGTTLDLVVLSGNKTFQHKKQVGGEFEYQYTEPATAANADQPWEYQKDGATWKAVQCLNFFVLPVKALQKEKEILEALKAGKDLPSDVELLKPSIVTFRGASYKTGKQIINHLMAIQQFRSRGLAVDGLSTIWKLGSTAETSDKKTYQVFTLEKSKDKLPKDFYEICLNWQRTVQESSVMKAPPPEDVEVKAVDVTAGESF